MWIGGWRHVEHLDPTKAHTGDISHKINQFLGLPDPNPLVRGTGPDGSGSFYHHLDSYCCVTSL